ncbi:MAG: hypothetical protein JW900_03480 [Anaerolineae bacterium]|nr:hypothetical protein [Anaerolineae bacterium]
MSETIVEQHGKEPLILVEFDALPEGVEYAAKSPHGIRSAFSPQELAQRSTRAIDSAMNAIHHVAQRVTQTVDRIAEKPSRIEVQFGLKLDADAGAYIARAGAEAGFTVTLVWQHGDEAGQ